ncbi:MAG: LamG domain-containing protein, partial [Kiritimatiellales bacterium]|nr:LamG domain-containing protein [Kiritimatiellales bacterium]
RCLNKVYKFSNGKYLLFFHNNGTRNYSGAVKGNRNPVWLAGGIEKDGFIHWSQPEVFLYVDNYYLGISYPDRLEQDGRNFISETQKTTASIHEVPAELLDMLWDQPNRKGKTRKGLALELAGDECAPGKVFAMPEFGNLDKGSGLALEFDVEVGKLDKSQILFSNRFKQMPPPEHGDRRHIGQGIEVKLLKNRQIQVTLDNINTTVMHLSGNPVIRPNKRHHIVVNIDCASHILSLVVDGKLLDGGERPYGFTRFTPYMSQLDGAEKTSFRKDFPGRVHMFRLYKRYLRTTEAIGNYRSTVKTRK